jgi:hypothetical protein
MASAWVRVRRAAAGCLLLVLPPVAAFAGGEQDLLPVPGTAERRAAAKKDADELLRTRFPTVEDLGPSWRRPWEVPGWLPGASGSEAEFRRKTAPRSIWTQFFGLSAADAEGLLRPALADLVRKMRAEGKAPPELQAFEGEQGLLSMAMLGLRTFTAPTIESPALFAARNHAVGFETARKVMAAGTEAEKRSALLDQTVTLLSTLDADLRALPLDEAVRRFVDEARLVRRAATMSYVHVSDDALRADPALGVPSHGRLTVDLRILAREAIGTRLRDPSREDLAAAAKELQRLFEASRKLVVELGNARAAAAKPIRVSLEPVALGESAWVAAFEGIETLGGDVAAYWARLRNGNAIVDVRGEGSYPRAWFLQELGHVLGAMDERTQVFQER